MIKKYSLSLLQKAINHALALDPDMPNKMKPLHGKTLEIIVSPLNTHFFMSFETGRLLLKDNIDGQADTIIRSSPMGLIRLSLLPTSKVRSLFNDKISISGDIELGQQIKELFDDIDIDWESHLAQFTGDVVAYQVGSLVRKSLAFQRQVTGSIRQDITEYLQEERRLFPPKEEVNDFFEDVDELSLSVERLEARINQLLMGS